MSAQDSTRQRISEIVPARPGQAIGPVAAPAGSDSGALGQKRIDNTTPDPLPPAGDKGTFPLKPHQWAIITWRIEV